MPSTEEPTITGIPYLALCYFPHSPGHSDLTVPTGPIGVRVRLTYLSKSPLSHSCIYPELLLISFVQIKGHFAGATTRRDTRTMRETTFSGWNIFQLFALWVCFTALSSPTIDTVMPLPQVPCPTTSGSFREHSTSP